MLKKQIHKSSEKSTFLFAVEVKEQGTLLALLEAAKPSIGAKKLKGMLTRGQVSIDGKVRTKYDTAVFKGQVIRVARIGLKNTTESKLLDIIYEDDDIIVINKPAGLLTISTDSEKDRTAYHLLMDYVRAGGKDNRIWVVHRLDRDTSGIVVFSKSEELKKQLQENWDELVKYRGYLAITVGVPKEPEGRLVSWLKENSIHIVYSSGVENDGKYAVTNYRVQKSNDKYALLQVWIETGRKNQIRVQLKEAGYPVIGDKRYGSAENPIQRLGLHASELKLTNPKNGALMTFTAKPNRKFTDFIAKSGK